MNPFEEDTASATCAICGRPTSARKLDPDGWCPQCRRALIRRSTWWSRVIAGVIAFSGANWMAAVQSEWVLRFLVGWLALFALLYYVLYKVLRRVLFDVFRRRTLPASRA